LSGDNKETLVRREYIQSRTLNIEQFVERLQDYNAGVYRCSEAELPPTIAHAMIVRGKNALVIPPAFPAEWLPAGKSFVRDHGLTYTELDQAEGALTGCTVAISFTASIVLTHSAHEGRRALTLIPDYHLCIVRMDQVVETVPEGIRALREFRTRPITTIAGPSATADIEMTRVKGVHGPRTLDVILV